MVTIQTVDAQALFTKKLIDVYQERPKPTSFLRSFFPSVPPVDSLEVSIQVQRGSEMVSVDVLRGTDGNMVSFEKSTEKMFIPPYHRLYFARTAMSSYEAMFRNREVSSASFAALINSTADHVLQLREMIERAYEIQAAKIFRNGIVPIKAGVQIDFKRKASSMNTDVSVTAPWATGATNIFNQIALWCEWLRKNGKVQTYQFNMLMGAIAIRDLFTNTTFLARQNFFNMSIDTVSVPQRNGVGGIYHGTITCGPYRVDLWSYPEFYQDPENANVLTPYLEDTFITLLPTNPRFVTAFAQTPQLLEPGEQPVLGEYIISEYTDKKARVREFHVESTALCIPVAVDQIFTAKVAV